MKPTYQQKKQYQYARRFPITYDEYKPEDFSKLLKEIQGYRQSNMEVALSLLMILLGLGFIGFIAVVASTIFGG